MGRAQPQSLHEPAAAVLLFCVVLGRGGWSLTCGISVPVVRGLKAEAGLGRAQGHGRRGAARGAGPDHEHLCLPCRQVRSLSVPHKARASMGESQ